MESRSLLRQLNCSIIFWLSHFSESLWKMVSKVTTIPYRSRPQLNNKKWLGVRVAGGKKGMKREKEWDLTAKSRDELVLRARLDPVYRWRQWDVLIVPLSLPPCCFILSGIPLMYVGFMQGTGGSVAPALWLMERHTGEEVCRRRAGGRTYMAWYISQKVWILYYKQWETTKDFWSKELHDVMYSF